MKFHPFVCLSALMLALSIPSVIAQDSQGRLARETPLTRVTDGDLALQKLLQGNERFVKGEWTSGESVKAARNATVRTQKPFAIILACADSRVSPELVFDQNVGDLFVVRVAGNVLSPDGQASIEYAVAVLQAPLLFIMGHENCGAVDAAIKSYKSGESFPGIIDQLVDVIEPSIAITSGKDENFTLHDAIETNVDVVIDKSEIAGTIISNAYASGKLKIAGGVYDLKTGKVVLSTDD